MSAQRDLLAGLAGHREHEQRDDVDEERGQDVVDHVEGGAAPHHDVVTQKWCISLISNIITAVYNISRHVCKVVCAARVWSLVMDSEELLQLELLVDGVETQDLLLADGGANRQVQLK